MPTKSPSDALKGLEEAVSAFEDRYKKLCSGPYDSPADADLCLVALTRFRDDPAGVMEQDVGKMAVPLRLPSGSIATSAACRTYVNAVAQQAANMATAAAERIMKLVDTALAAAQAAAAFAACEAPTTTLACDKAEAYQRLLAKHGNSEGAASIEPLLTRVALST